ncbi:MAG: hypothetical protein K8F27_15285 [Sulfuricellaceae bacterium]|nr:hypothetical protein [Sulfuricellaceae bacterium]
MLNASMLSIIEEAGTAVLILTEGLEEAELLGSRLTRAEASRQVGIVAETAANLPEQTRAVLAEVDWNGWESVARRLDAGGGAADEALWFAVRSLVPAVLMWLRVYRQNQPELFAYTTAAASGES